MISNSLHWNVDGWMDGWMEAVLVITKLGGFSSKGEYKISVNFMPANEIIIIGMQLTTVQWNFSIMQTIFKFLDYGAPR